MINSTWMYYSGRPKQYLYINTPVFNTQPFNKWSTQRGCTIVAGLSNTYILTHLYLNTSCIARLKHKLRPSSLFGSTSPITMKAITPDSQAITLGKTACRQKKSPHKVNLVLYENICGTYFNTAQKQSFFSKCYNLRIFFRCKNQAKEGD